MSSASTPDCINYSPCHWGKIPERNTRASKSLLGLMLWEQSRCWSQASTVGRQRGMSPGAQLNVLFYSVQDANHCDCATHIQRGSSDPISNTPLHTPPTQIHAWTFISMVAISPSKLTTKVNHHSACYKEIPGCIAPSISGPHPSHPPEHT